MTGGAGYIGALLQGACQAGYRPVVLDNLATGHAAFVKWGSLIRADVADAAALQGHCADFAVFGDDYATGDGTAVR